MSILLFTCCSTFFLASNISTARSLVTLTGVTSSPVQPAQLIFSFLGHHWKQLQVIWTSRHGVISTSFFLNICYLCDFVKLDPLFIGDPTGVYNVEIYSRDGNFTL